MDMCVTIPGEWWNGNVVDIEEKGFASGGVPNNSDAYTINGKPGDLYPCSKNGMYYADLITKISIITI